MIKLHIVAVGRLRKSPELSLIEDYLDRATKTGRAFGVGPCRVIEVEDKRGGGMAAEAELLQKAIPKGATIIAFDEHGKQTDSIEFSNKISELRDAGQQDLVFLIGGADGLDPSIKAQADMTLSLGKMVWPHMLVRVMAAEQIYRATSIMAGSPYHRI